MSPTSALATLLLACACSAGSPPAPLSVGPGTTEEPLKADAVDGPRAELKVLVDEWSIEEVRDDLGLDRDLAQERAVWFYDTLDLALFEAGVILRARSVRGDDDDSTVKVRPLAADQVDPAWFEEDGFKCELDASPASQVSSCSFTSEQEEDQIEEAADGERDIDTLFSSGQEDFLAAFGPPSPWEDLVPFGAIDALVWKLESDDLPGALTAEHWDLGAGQMLELSMKVDLAGAGDQMDELLAWLDDRGIPLSAEQESKTRRALEALRASD